MRTGQKKKMSPQIAPLLRSPGRVFWQSLSSLAVALGVLAFSLPAARCQMDSRLPLTSRVAGVAFVTTLESLSVGAAPTAIPHAVRPGGPAVTASAPVAVSSRWVVPALPEFQESGHLRGCSKMVTPGSVSALGMDRNA